MASDPITSWQTEGEKVEAITDFLLGSKITADGDCSPEIRRRLLLGRKAMTNKDTMLKSRDIALLAKVHIIKAMVFPVVMYGCKSWTMKKAEHQRTDASQLWYWRSLLRVPWWSNRSILKEITLNIHWKDLCWSWSSNTLATWCKELTHWKRPWCWGRVKAEGKGDDRIRRLGGITDSVGMNLGKTPGDGERQGSLGCCSPWGRKELDTTWGLNNHHNKTCNSGICLLHYLIKLH